MVATTSDVRQTVARVDLEALRGNVRAIRGLLDDGALASGRPAPAIVATVHPSAVLRDRSDRHDEAYKAFVDDLLRARGALT